MSSPVVLQLPTVTFTRNKKTKVGDKLEQDEITNHTLSPEQCIAVVPVVIDFERLLKGATKAQEQV